MKNVSLFVAATILAGCATHQIASRATSKLHEYQEMRTQNLTAVSFLPSL